MMDHSPEARLARRLTKCFHFTGIQNDRCSQDIPYESVRDVVAPGLPCIATGGVPCPSFRAWTIEESEAREREITESINKTSAARRRILEHIKATGQNVGTVECPTCQKQLHYSRATSNGHIWAHCETPKCTGWME